MKDQNAQKKLRRSQRCRGSYGNGSGLALPIWGFWRDSNPHPSPYSSTMQQRWTLQFFGLIRTTARQPHNNFPSGACNERPLCAFQTYCHVVQGKALPAFTKGLLVRAATFYRGGLNGQKGSGP